MDRLDKQKIGSTAGVHPKVLRAQQEFGRKPGANRRKESDASHNAENALQNEMLHGRTT